MLSRAESIFPLVFGGKIFLFTLTGKTRARGNVYIAIYHLSLKIFSRGKGASAVAKAAYRAAEIITNEYNGITSDYTRKKGVVYKEIMLPDHAPREYKDRSTLWNAVEMCERYKTAQLAREVEVALPVELTAEQNISLVKSYVQKQFVDKGMCADVCVHDTGTGNPHAHIMLTMRAIEPDGKWAQKSRTVNGVKVPTVDWNDRANADLWREAWADEVNAFMERENRTERIDHRSNEDRGIIEIPTVHLGVAAHQMETRKGIKTERGNRNREVDNINREIRQLRARIRKCNEWLYSQPIEDTPKMIEIATRISKGENLNTQWKKIANLKASAKMFNFLTDNHITDMAQLADKVKNINNEFYEVSKKIKAVDRRLETLDEHIKQYDIFKKHKAVYEKYNDIQPALADKILRRAPKAEYYEKHGKEIQKFENAKDYFDGVMNGRTKIPIKEWKAELEEKTAERFTLCESYYRLKDEVRNVEILRKGAEEIMREETQREQQQRNKKHEMEI